jgi:hypothetical protein
MNFNGSERLELDIPSDIHNNFLKIVTNIFYYNGIKTYKELLEIFKSQEPKPFSVASVYSKNLKATRKEVYRWFNIKTNYNQVKTIYITRLFIYTLPNDHPIRTQYLRDSAEYDKVLDNLQNKIIPTAFIEDDSPTIKDVIYK